MKKIYTSTVVVKENGVLKPSFNLPKNGHMSGELKYFQELVGKKVKITIEVLSTEEDEK